MNPYLKLAASAGLFGSLFYLVLSGKIAASDYQVLATGALGAVGGWHARSTGKPDHIGDGTKMVPPQINSTEYQPKESPQ